MQSQQNSLGPNSIHLHPQIFLLEDDRTFNFHFQTKCSSLLDFFLSLSSVGCLSWGNRYGNLSSCSEWLEIRVNTDLRNDSKPGGGWVTMEGIGVEMLDGFTVDDFKRSIIGY